MSDPMGSERLRDVNEQLTLATIRTQEQLDESVESYRDLVEGLDAIVWEAEADPWRFTFVSRRAQAMLGYPVERWLTEPDFWTDLMHSEDRAFAVGQSKTAARDRRDFRVEYRAIAADGRIAWLAMIARIRLKEDRPVRYRGLLVDVGETIRADNLQRLVAYQTAELLAKQNQLRALATELNLAEHRERTKLAAELHDHLAQLLVLGRLKLGQLKRVEGDVRQYADLIQLAEDAVNEALVYARTLVANLRPPVLHEFGLPAALRWLAEQMQRYNLTVVIEMPEPPEASISEDHAVLLFQSVRELLINISKHAQTDRATVRLQRHAGSLRLQVRDEGCGFQLSAVAEQTAAPLSSKFGLFSIRERMTALGGEFEIESAPGRGTTATLALPVETRDARGERGQRDRQDMREDRSNPVAVIPAVPPVSPASARFIRVLLVDDHAMLRQGLRGIVDAYDHLHVVGEAGDGQEAIDSVRKLKPDVVVMDINMPRMNGIEATKRIKEEFPHIAVIGLSVHEEGDLAQTMREAGICGYVRKESAVETLCHAIEEASQHKHWDEPSRANHRLRTGLPESAG